MEDKDSKGLIASGEAQSPGESAGKLNESLLKSRYYFDMEDAAREVKEKADDFDKVVSSAKFAGKLISNVGMFGVKLGARAVEHAPAIAAKMAEQMLAKNSDISDERRSSLERLAEKRTWSDLVSGGGNAESNEDEA